MSRTQFAPAFRLAAQKCASRNICMAATKPFISHHHYNRFSRFPSQNTKASVSYVPVRFHSTPVGKVDKPTYQLTFTCKACDNRSSHLVTKQAYHHGTVLIQCPSCRNRHLIADHLNVFGQGKKNSEDILREKGDGEVVQKMTIDPNQVGDIEWEGPGEAPEIFKLEDKNSKS